MAARRFEGKEQAVSYLKYRVSPQELIIKIMDYMEKKTPKPFMLAVDVGCGSGQGTVLLAPYFTRVVGTDVSAAQLEMASVRHNPPNVSYSKCPAEELNFAAGEVDLLTAMTAAHWFDQERFLKEADRVLRPGGCLALLSYTMDMKLEYKDVSNTLNYICKEFYAALLPYRSACLGPSSRKIYSDMFNLCTYPVKEWHDNVEVRRSVSVKAYIGMVQTFSNYEVLKQKDRVAAERLSNDIMNQLLSAMRVTSPETEVVMVFNYFYWIACKPISTDVTKGKVT